jgi:ketosteroid isomerase-like protein
MRHSQALVVLIVVGLLTTCTMQAPAAEPAGQVLDEQAVAAVTQEVLATNQAMTEAGNANDLDALFGFIIDGADPIVQDGVLFATRQEARQAVEQGFQGVERVERSFDHTTVMVLSTTAALLTASGKTKVVLDDGRAFSRPFAVTLLFVHDGQEWRVRHGHYSVPDR